MDQAKEALGFSPRATPTPDEIVKAYRAKAIANHPDRGGDPEKMVEINVAKDILDGKARPSSGGGAGGRPPPGAWRPDPGPVQERKRPEPPKVVETITGNTFESAVGEFDAPVEIKFISKTGYGGARPTPDALASYSYDIWALYGQSKTHHIFACLRVRRATTYYDQARNGTVVVEESWESLVEKAPIAKDLAKIALPKLKAVVRGWPDGLEPSKQFKYIEWPGGRMSQAMIAKVKASGYSGGAALKDILLGLGLVGEEHGKGRKTNVEIYFRSNKEKRRKIMETRDRAVVKVRVNMWEGYDWYIRLNGTEYLLEEDTVHNLINNHFISGVIDPNSMGEGIPKNITKLKGGRFGILPGDAMGILVKSMTTEPMGLRLGLQNAVEEWAVKTAAMVLRVAGIF